MAYVTSARSEDGILGSTAGLSLKTAEGRAREGWVQGPQRAKAGIHHAECTLKPSLDFRDDCVSQSLREAGRGRAPARRAGVKCP